MCSDREISGQKVGYLSNEMGYLSNEMGYLSNELENLSNKFEFSASSDFLIYRMR